MNDVVNAIGFSKGKAPPVRMMQRRATSSPFFFSTSTAGRTTPQLLSDAREHLTRAIEVRPKHAPSHAALGYTYDLTEGGAEQALACFREARRLDPRDRQGDVYVLTLIEATGREEEALAEIEGAAPRHDVDLHALRRELTAAGMPTNAGSLPQRVHSRTQLLQVVVSGRSRTHPERSRARPGA